ncbi:MAG: hypothetical protein PVG27_07485 [Chloroflexota bacterium]
MDIAQHAYVPSKTQRPEVPASAIERVGLADRLDALLDHPITLVTAPAGFGKSWAVAGWLQDEARPPSCWITVDSYDDDAVRLWTHLIGAVRDAGLSAAAAEAAGLITGSPAGWPRIVDALAAGLAEGAEPFVIVLDDIHAVTDPEALASLGQFLAQLPAATHVVLVGRRDPDIPLARWRVTGRLLEIRTKDLRCSLTESESLVRDALGLRLTDEDVAIIHERTMGWLAGIRLAATVVSRRPGGATSAEALTGVSTIDGAYETLGDYLIEEVLDTLDEDTRRFLLDTSVLTALDVALCDHMAQTDASALTLARLERSGFFLTRLGDGTYRLHGLVRDALLAILHRQTARASCDCARRTGSTTMAAPSRRSATRLTTSVPTSPSAGSSSPPATSSRPSRSRPPAPSSSASMPPATRCPRPGSWCGRWRSSTALAPRTRSSDRWSEHGAASQRWTTTRQDSSRSTFVVHRIGTPSPRSRRSSWSMLR